MGTPFICFSCDVTIARSLDIAVQELGGRVTKGAIPEIDTNNWREEDWDLWRCGGYVQIDSEIAAAVSFYRGRDVAVVGSCLGSPTILRLLKGLGAFEFSRSSWVGESRTSRFYRSDAPFLLPDCVNVKARWPQAPGKHCNQFCSGTAMVDGFRIPFETGMAYSESRPAFYLYYASQSWSLAPSRQSKALDRFVTVDSA